MKASAEGHKEVVESLLSAGADVNLKNLVCDIYDYYDERCFYMFLISFICNFQNVLLIYFLLFFCSFSCLFIVIYNCHDVVSD